MNLETNPIQAPKIQKKPTQRAVPPNYKLILTSTKPAYAIYHGVSDSAYYPDHCVSARFIDKRSKAIDWYRYKTEEERSLSDQKFIANRIAAQAIKDAQAAERRKPHTLKIGDIVVASWGYDQTNIDAYQVVGQRGKHSLQLRKIAVHTTQGTGWASDLVVPIKDAFLNDEIITKRSNSTNSVRFESYMYAHHWDGKRAYYRSWYA